jgi:Ca-activated chloride channel family protein
LDLLSRENRGQSEYVRPDENIEAHVSRLYSKISSPVMTDVQLTIELDGAPAEQGGAVNRVYPAQVFDLFEGEQLVVVGRYRVPGAAKVVLTGKVGGQEQRLDFPAQFVPKSLDESFGFVEKIWAMRRIGEIIDQLDLVGQNQELINELVELSTKHGILTPYTSFLADDTTNVRELAANSGLARDRLADLEQSEGRGGFAQRAEKRRLQSAGEADAPAAGAPVADSFDSDGARTQPQLAGGAGGQGQGYYVNNEDEVVLAENVQNVGNKAFYRRADDKRWVDSTVTEEMEQNAIHVVQFSDEYFELAAKHGKRLSQYLAFESSVLVNLDGQAYSIDPPTE